MDYKLKLGNILNQSGRFTLKLFNLFEVLAIIVDTITDTLKHVKER